MKVPDKGPDARPRHQQPGPAGARVQRQFGEGGQQLRIRHGEEAEGEPDTDHGEGDRVRPAIPQPAPQFSEDARTLVSWRRRHPPDHEQCRRAHEKAAGCQVQRRSQSGQFDDRSRHCGAKDAPRVHDRRIENDGVHQVIAVHQIANYGQPSRGIDGLQCAEDESRRINVPQGDQPTRFQRRDPQHQEGHQALGQHQQPASVEPVGEGAAEQHEPQRGHPVKKDHEAHAGRGLGQLQHQPAQDEELHTPAQRLGVGADPEPAVIPVPQRPKGLEPASDGEYLGQLIHRISRVKSKSVGLSGQQSGEIRGNPAAVRA